MKAWLVTGDCGDYYCEGEHPVGVALSEQEAERLAAEVRAQKWASGASSWASVQIEAIESGVVLRDRSNP